MQQKFLQNLCFGAVLCLFPMFVHAANGVIDSLPSYLFTTETAAGDTSTMTIYAGRAGTNCTGGSTSEPCHTCASLTTALMNTSKFACNDNGIHDNLILTVAFHGVDAASYGTAGTTLTQSFVKVYADDHNVNITDTISLPTAGVANQVVSIPIRWSNIASALSKTLEDSFQTTLKVGFNPNSSSTVDSLVEPVTINIKYRYVAESPLQRMGCSDEYTSLSGFCQYGVYPGDEKLFIVNAGAFCENNSSLAVQDLQLNTAVATSGSADPSGMTSYGVRFFVKEEGNFATDFVPAEWDTTDVAVSTSCSLAKGRITGLKNGTKYTVMAANIDKGGNVTYFFDSSATTGDWKMSSDDPIDDSSIPLGSTQAATPQPVTGLLDNKNCFIATAAYGSGDAADVETLRQFRNSFLLTWEGGRSFVKFYYKNSPPIAHFIAEREWLKLIVRESLKPFVFIAKVGSHFGLVGLMILFWASLAFFAGSVAWLRKGNPA